MSDNESRRLVLVTGGVRGGKSTYALELVRAASDRVLFVATALPNDSELLERIDKHRAERPRTWRTAEATEGALGAHLEGDEPALILDCLTLYVGRRLTEGVPARSIIEEVEEACGLMSERFGLAVIVTNEVGWGVIPDNELARAYSEVLGKANQVAAARADEVVLMVSGIPMKVK
jgi:adenosylcobinamide kinase / adenosylcobinamide-phosphate guanylyltransferase